MDPVWRWGNLSATLRCAAPPLLKNCPWSASTKRHNSSHSVRGDMRSNRLYASDHSSLTRLTPTTSPGAARRDASLEIMDTGAEQPCRDNVHREAVGYLSQHTCPPPSLSRTRKAPPSHLDPSWWRLYKLARDAQDADPLLVPRLLRLFLSISHPHYSCETPITR